MADFQNSLRPHGTRLTEDAFWNDGFFTLEGVALPVGVLCDHPEVVHLVLHQVRDAVRSHVCKTTAEVCLPRAKKMTCFAGVQTNDTGGNVKDNPRERPSGHP